MSFRTMHLRSVVTPDGAVILDMDQNVITTLNTTGGYVWQRLQQGKPIDEIVCDLSHETGVDPARVALDVQAFLDQLTSKRLLHN
jgi:Coenzyme PQQ synthesis protein D (PqqD)